MFASRYTYVNYENFAIPIRDTKNGARLRIHSSNSSYKLLTRSLFASNSAIGRISNSLTTSLGTLLKPASLNVRT